MPGTSLAAVSRAELVMGGRAWAGSAGDGCRFNMIFVEIKERASGAQRCLPGTDFVSAQPW